MEFTCCVCGEGHKLMASVRTIGTYFMCNDCIEKEEIKTGTIAVFGPLGLEFVSPIEASKLLGHWVCPHGYDDELDCPDCGH